MSNVEMRHYSGMASEEEVLFLPLSSFMITYIGDSIYMNKKIKVIKFIYLGMFDIVFYLAIRDCKIIFFPLFQRS